MPAGYLFPEVARERVNRADPAINRLEAEDRPAHAWYRFVLSFPPHLVRTYIEAFGIKPGMTLLDPFCGTGTTPVEAKKQGVRGVGVEANPIAAFATHTKLDWDVSPRAVREFADRASVVAARRLSQDGIADEPSASARASASSSHADLLRVEPEADSLLLANSICPRPLHKVLVLRDVIDSMRICKAAAHARLALARTMVDHASNLHFGPEVGVGPPRGDASVIGPWREAMNRMASDLTTLRRLSRVESRLVHSDSREMGELMPARSVDAVFTSPPYPNEKDYTRTTRLESVVLGYLRNKAELRALKKSLVRSNTRTAYVLDTDDRFVASNARIQEFAARIEARRIELGKTSGFERMYHRVTKLYFGGMARHLESLKPVLKPGAMLGYVVGDQAWFLRVMIRTGEILGEIAEGLGYELVRIDLFRTRLATATRDQLREEVVILRWPGTGRRR